MPPHPAGPVEWIESGSGIRDPGFGLGTWELETENWLLATG
jgi:hypothetical protein